MVEKAGRVCKEGEDQCAVFDVETAVQKLAEMYVTGYKAKLKKDTRLLFTGNVPRGVLP
ncbi:hypothetical protein [Blautia sp. HCP28S3_G10]|uniref:hypothetical protein n=1 Tax=Blautia sp. HCP28S3_G10 TaxID=3438908 RepID=UPI003F8AC131